MDEHEYLERFRVAILWDEFRRRKFPDIHIEIFPHGSPAERRRNMRPLDRHYKRHLPFKWEDLISAIDDIMDYAHWLLRYGSPAGHMTEFRLMIWRLRQQMNRVRNNEVRDYCEHLVIVAEETLKMLDRR